MGARTQSARGKGGGRHKRARGEGKGTHVAAAQPEPTAPNAAGPRGAWLPRPGPPLHAPASPGSARAPGHRPPRSGRRRRGTGGAFRVGGAQCACCGPHGVVVVVPCPPCGAAWWCWARWRRRRTRSERLQARAPHVLLLLLLLLVHAQAMDGWRSVLAGRRSVIGGRGCMRADPGGRPSARGGACPSLFRPPASRRVARGLSAGRRGVSMAVTEIKLFGKWSFEDVEVRGRGLTRRPRRRACV